MKSKPFKFRYVNEIVGAFVLCVVLLLFAGIFVAGKSQDWFVPVTNVELNFPAEGSLGLQVGSEVQILGTLVGRVTEIEVDTDGFMTGEMTIKGDFIQFVRTDSIVIAKKKFGVAGDAYIDITKGKGPLLPEGAGVVVTKDTDLTELVESLVSQIEEKTVPILDSLREALVEYTGLAADLRSPDHELQKLLKNFNEISEGMIEGRGAAGRLLSDQETADQFSEMVNQVQALLAQVQEILKDVKETTASLPAITSAVESEARYLPGTLLQTQETIRETERLIEGVQQHWLLRKYVPDRLNDTGDIYPYQVIPVSNDAEIEVEP